MMSRTPDWIKEMPPATLRLILEPLVTATLRQHAEAIEAHKTRQEVARTEAHAQEGQQQ